MKKYLFVLILLVSCTPTLADPDSKVLKFLETPRYNLEVVASKPIEALNVAVAGLELRIKSPYCQNKCEPDANNFITLLYPDEPDATYGRKITLKVLSGIPIKGRVLATLAGENVSRPAVLELYEVE